MAKTLLEKAKTVKVRVKQVGEITTSEEEELIIALMNREVRASQVLTVLGKKSNGMTSLYGFIDKVLSKMFDEGKISFKK